MKIFNAKNRINKIIPIYIRAILNSEVVLAGGAARSVFSKEQINDFDLFIKQDSLMDTLKEYFVSLHQGVVVFQCPENKLITIKTPTTKIQLIRYAYKDVEDLINQFDFTVCQYALDGNKLVVNSKEILRHTKKKWLILNKVTYPVATLKRTTKYIKYGYYPTTSLYETIVQSIWEHSPDIKDRTLVYID